MKTEITDSEGKLTIGPYVFYYGSELTINGEMGFRYTHDGTVIAEYSFSELESDDEGDYAGNILLGIGKLLEDGYIE